MVTYTYGDTPVELRPIAHQGEQVWEARLPGTTGQYAWIRGYGRDYREAAIDVLRVKQQVSIKLELGF